MSSFLCGAALGRRFESLFSDLCVSEQTLGEFGMQGVAAAMRDDMAHDFASSEGEVANNIEHFVAYAFVGETQRVADRSVRAENQQIARGHAFANALRKNALGGFLRNERAARCQLAAKRIGRDIECEHLVANRRLVAKI
jgi:hypothetical protein